MCVRAYVFSSRPPYKSTLVCIRRMFFLLKTQLVMWSKGKRKHLGVCMGITKGKGKHLSMPNARVVLVGWDHLYKKLFHHFSIAALRSAIVSKYHDLYEWKKRPCVLCAMYYIAGFMRITAFVNLNEFSDWLIMLFVGRVRKLVLLFIWWGIDE